MILETIVFAVAFMAMAVSIISTLIALKSRSKIKIHIKEEYKPDKRTGLLLLIGPAKGAAPAAIEYHRPKLRHCWLIGTKDSLPTVQQLIKIYQEITFYWGKPDYLVDPDEIRNTYEVVSRVFDIEVSKAGLRNSDVIADITGGLKPMTAGMVLACVDHKCNMQYMKAPRNEAGEVIYGGIHVPIKIDTTLKSKTF
jgi:hypothetical protein